MNVYDFDETIYYHDSTADFVMYLWIHRPKTLLNLPRLILYGILYGLHIVPKQTFKDNMYHMFVYVDDLEEVSWQFVRSHMHLIKPFYKKQQKEDDIVISASPAFNIEKFCLQLGITHCMHRTLDGLVLGDTQLVVQVRGAHAQAGVDAGTAGALEGLGSRVDILLNGAGETAYHGVVAGKLADLLNGDEVARAGNGETGLDDVDLQAQQLLCDEQLLLGVHGSAGRLLTVAQGGIKNCNLSSHGFLQTGLRA